MVRIFCDACGSEVKENNANEVVISLKKYPFDSDNLKVDCLCGNCANDLKRIVNDFLMERG